MKQIVEMMARAIEPEDWRVIDAHCGPKDNPRIDPDCRAVEMRDDSLFRVRRALAAIEQAGFVVVPKEPTEAMIEAGLAEQYCGEPADRLTVEQGYAAMIEAATRDESHDPQA